MAVEEVVTQNFRQDLIDSGIVIQTEDLWKIYSDELDRLPRHADPRKLLARWTSGEPAG